MKKLMVAMAIVAAAINAQASVSYQFGGGGNGYYTIYGMSSSTLNKMLNAEVSTTIATTVTDPTTQSKRDANCAKNADGVIYNTVANWMDRSGSFTMVKANAAYQSTSAKLPSSPASVITIGDESTTIDDVKWAFILYEDESSKTPSYKFRVVLGDNAKVAGANSSWTSWVTAKSYVVDPIPEPTSGLLMLLGVAGLALKRKRA